MQTNSWFNLSAARARLHEIESELVRLEQERTLLTSLLGGSPPGSTRAAGAGKPKGARRRRGGPTLASILVEVIAAGTKDKAWEVNELVAAVNQAHPGRLPEGVKASGLVSATLSQDKHAKAPLFVSRKGRNRRANLYRLAG